jgi:hypothetical protein
MLHGDDWTYWDGITLADCGRICLYIGHGGGYGAVFRRLTVTGAGPGQDGANSGVISYISPGDDNNSWWDIVQNSTFSDLAYGSGFTVWKIYGAREMVFENNSTSNQHSRTGESESMLAIKGNGNQDFTVRNNYWADFEAIVPFCCGSMATDSGGAAGPVPKGEILYNLVLPSVERVSKFNEFGESDDVWVYRNTFMGTVELHNLADVGDGPWTFTRNVIINSSFTGGTCPQRLTCNNVNASMVTMTDNLQGVPADNIASTTTGELQGTYLTDHGPDSATPKGHMISITEGGGGGSGTLFRLRLRAVLEWLRGERNALAGAH